MKKCVLVIGIGDQHFREYTMRGLANVARVVLIGGRPLSWPAPYVADYREVDLQDEVAVFAAAAELAASNFIEGVITWDEMLVARAAEIGARPPSASSSGTAVRRSGSR
jgi:hypothetical protein